MTEYAIRLTPPYSSEQYHQRWTSFTEHPAVTKWLLAEESGKETGKLHFHAYLVWSKGESLLRKRVRDLFACIGNSNVSIKVVDDAKGWLSYCMKDAKYTHNLEQTYLDRVPKWVEKQERKGTRGKLDKMSKFAKARSAKGVTGHSMAVYDYHEENGLLLPNSHVMQQYVWSLRMMKGGKEGQKSRVDYFQYVWRGGYDYDPEEDPKRPEAWQQENTEEPDAF